MNQIVLDGIILTDKEVEGEAGVIVTIDVDSDATMKQRKSITKELTFYGAAFDKLKQELIDPADGRLREVPAFVYETCGAPKILLLQGVVRGAELKWCEGDCFCTGVIIEKTEQTKAMDCIESTLIADNRNGFRGQPHRRITYCDELRPDWLMGVLLSASTGIVGILITITPIIAVFTAIINSINLAITAVNTLPGVNIGLIDFDGNPNTTFLQEYTDWADRIILGIVGCGRMHPSPFLRSYIQNVCTICGLNLRSSILNQSSSEYFDTVLFSAPVEKGTRDETVTYIDENEPIESLETLLVKICGVFNAGRRIIGTDLHFERTDMMPQGPTWVDPAVLKAQGLLIGKVCYNWSTDDLSAFAQVGFMEDPLDVVGNEARDLYRDTVEWNQPYNASQKGEHVSRWPFSMVRCRKDGIGRDILSDYEQTFLQSWIQQYDTSLMLERGVSALPKLIIIDGSTSVLDTRTRRFPVDSNTPGGADYEKPDDENYNFPFHVNEYNCAPNTGYSTTKPNMGIYGRFHAIKNPKVVGTRGLEFKFTFKYNGQYLRALDAFAGVPLTHGTGSIKTITIDTKERTILVAGKV